MPYGEIVSNAFRLIWREKKLWLFGILGLALSGVSSAIYLGLSLGWQNTFSHMIMGFTYAPDSMSPDAVLSQMFRGMRWMFGALGLGGCLAFIGYIVNLFMRGATISEAGRAWRGEHVDVRRGLGEARPVYVFLIDLVWWAPSLLLVGCAYAGLIASFAGLVGAAEGSGNSGDVGAAVAGSLGLMVAGICGIVCIGVLVALAQVLFSPMMYQSAVQGKREFGAALREGWKMGRDHLGAMFVFALIRFALYMAMSIITQAIYLPFAGFWMTDWMRMIADMTAGQMPTPPSMSNGFVLVMGSLALAVATVVLGSFMQSFSLTLYADIYRRLGGETGAPVLPPPSSDALVAPDAA